MRSRRVAVAAGLLCLVGCAGTKSLELPDLTGWDTRQAVLAQTDDWSFRGRIAVSNASDGFNGKLNWAQHGERFDADLSGPFGAGRVQIDGNRKRLTVTEKDGTVTRLRDAERDLQARYGRRIPVTSLRYWALGIPDPAHPAATRLDDQGRLASLVQGGWQVTIGQYRDGGGQAMPRRITAERDDSRVRLVIDRWIFR